ncbi:MAG: DUF5671 domain-containing protein [Patescibacteria group bacterium]|jgi:hypothetical protein
METSTRSTAKDVFFYLLNIVTLTVSVVSFITLYFQYINVKFPDTLQMYYTGSLDIIRGSMAALIVVWPVFILVSWLIYREIKIDPQKMMIAIRKSLLYFTLFVTSIVIIVDLITLVNYFLNGEITTRFILKVLVVLLTASVVFSYYLWDLRRDVHEKNRVSRIVAISTSVIAFVSILLGFVFVGTPAEQRLVRFDERRLTDLSTIQNEIVNYYTYKQILPTTLTDLNNSISGFSVPVDPETGESYEYLVSSETSFQLCASFLTESTVEDLMMSGPMYYQDPYQQNWAHGIGRVCYERTIDPDLYQITDPMKLK